MPTWTFQLSFFLFFGKGNRSEVHRAGSRGTKRWIHHGLAETQGWAGSKDQGKAGVTSLTGKFWAVSWKPVRCHFTISLQSLSTICWCLARWKECHWEPPASGFSVWATEGSALFMCHTAVPVTPWCFRVLHAWPSCSLWHKICRVTLSCAGTGQPSPCKSRLFVHDSTERTTIWIRLLNFCNRHKKTCLVNTFFSAR